MGQSKYLNNDKGINMKEKIKIETKIFKNGLISQELLNERDNGRMESILKIVIDTREEQIKQALIKLGWTPPKE